MRFSLGRHPLPWGGELNLHPEQEKISQQRNRVSSRSHRPEPMSQSHTEALQAIPVGSSRSEVLLLRGHTLSPVGITPLCVLLAQSLCPPRLHLAFVCSEGVQREAETSPSLYCGETGSPTGERTHPRSFQLEPRTAPNCSLNSEFRAHSWSQECPFLILRADGDSSLAGATGDKVRSAVQ